MNLLKTLPRVLTAVVTPFNENYMIDLDSMIELIRFQLMQGAGVVLFGTTGECPTLDTNERDLILNNVVQKFNDIHKFVIGVGGNNTKECIDLIQTALKIGFNTFMLTTPYYNKPTQIGLQEHFKLICSKFPQSNFILYNVPGRTVTNLLPNTVLNICESCPNVFAIKEASGDLGQMIMIRRILPNLLLYCGDDGLIVPAMSIGAYGIISVLSNFTPKTLTLIVHNCLHNNYSGAFNLYSQVDEIVKLLFSESNPSPIKYLLMINGLIQSDCVRLPLVKMQNADNMTKLKLLTDKLHTYYLSHQSNDYLI